MLVKEESGKINFIDKNDCFVGFDFERDCCESFGWYYSENRNSNDFQNSDPDALHGFFFDTKSDPFDVIDTDDDECSIVGFTLINEAADIKYLFLYNSHNGFYSHGWGSSWGFGGSL